MGTLEGKPMKVYTAGPLGFSEAGKMAHALIVKMLQDLGHEILDPWTYDPAAIGQVLAMPYGAERKAAWERLNPLIGKANQSLIDESNLIFAVLDGVGLRFCEGEEDHRLSGRLPVVGGQRGIDRQPAGRILHQGKRRYHH
jgi:hypothetical protein